MKLTCVASMSLFAAAALISAGCSKSPQQSGKAGSPDKSVQTADVPAHGDWWCGEHGVPEEDCAQCDKDLVAKFKAKGDWCKEHNRPESQCFICGPARFDKFADRYEAKYGKKPPMPKD